MRWTLGHCSGEWVVNQALKELGNSLYGSGCAICVVGGFLESYRMEGREGKGRVEYLGLGNTR